MSYIMAALGWVLRVCSDLTGNYGVAIILFTVLIKAVLMPLTVKQQKSMLKTQKLQPLLMEIQQKYANDKEKLNQETMKLYQKYNVNPMSGCLPLLIQLPILMMLYWVVRKPVVYIMGFGEDEVWRIVSAVTEWAENGGSMESFLSALNIESINVLTDNAYKMFGNYEIQIARFLDMNPEVMSSHWITETGKDYLTINFNFIGLDMSQTPNLSAFLGIFIGKAHLVTADIALLWIIPVLSGFSAWLTSEVTKRQNPQAQQQQTNKDGEQAANPMKGMMIMMPLMSAWFAFTLPAAIGLYWIISNILSLVQQMVLNKVLNPGITQEEIEGEIINAKKNRKKRKK